MIKIELTKDAVSFLGSEIQKGIGFTDDEAEEIGQTFISLCEISEISPEPSPISDLGKSEFFGRCYRHRTRFTPSPQFGDNCPACYFESELSKERKTSEGEGIHEACLQKTARDLLEYRERYGARAFRDRFGISDIPDSEFIEFLRLYLEEGEKG